MTVSIAVDSRPAEKWQIRILSKKSEQLSLYCAQQSAVKRVTRFLGTDRETMNCIGILLFNSVLCYFWGVFPFENKVENSTSLD